MDVSALFIIAEMGAAHNGSLERARGIVTAAADAGASAIKFQTFKPESMVGDPSYIIDEGPWKGRRLIELYEQAYLPWEWHAELFDYARALGLVPMSSPFDAQAIEFLESIGCERYKIASCENNDLELIRAAARTDKPLYISTGLASDTELFQARAAAYAVYGHWPILLKCISAYPAYEDGYLADLAGWIAKFGGSFGISDHTYGIGVAVAAVALGARTIEKHLTLSREDNGLDDFFALEPDEFGRLVAECRRAKAACVRNLTKIDINNESASRKLRRSLYFTADLPAGTVLQSDHIRTARPALGLSPLLRDRIIGHVLTQPVMLNQPVRWEVMAPK